MEYTFEDHAEHGPGYYDRHTEIGGAFVGVFWALAIYAIGYSVYLMLR